MAVTTQVALGTMVDEALDTLYRAVERPALVFIGSDGLSSNVDTTMTLGSNADGNYDINVTDVLEYGQEMMLVTNKTTDTTPVYTVQRGYLGTSATATLPTGTPVIVNPKFPRRDLARAIQRAFSGPISKGLPYSKISAVLTVATNDRMLEVPADVLRPVSILDPFDGSVLLEHGQFDFFENLPAALSSTGNAIRLPGFFGPNYDTVYFEYFAAYPWSNTPVVETSTIPVYYGAEDLASLYAAWFVVTGSELSRVENSDINAFASENPNIKQVNYQTVKSWQTNFYMRLDEARAIRPAKQQHRPYRRMRTV